jgi:type I restriction enzyme S subunit
LSYSLPISNFTDSSIRSDDLRYIAPSEASSYDNVRLQHGDIIIATVGSWPTNPASVVGKVVCVPITLHQSLLNQNAVILRTREGANQRYLFYCLKNPAFQNYIVNTAMGSANQASITLESIFKYEFDLPLLCEQKVISEVLGALDDKIELNRKMNATLEAMARALFKSWFVDFDPVRAKMEGRQPFSMDSETAALFPSRLTPSELGDVPEGWATGTIQDLCERIESGGTPSRNEECYWKDGTIPWLTSGEVRQKVVLTTKECISEVGLKNSNAKMWPSMTTVVAMYGATAGQVTLLANTMTANQACCALIPQSYTQAFIFIKTSQSVKIYEDQATGSAQQNLNKTLVSNLETIVPTKDCLAAFEKTAGEYIQAIIQNFREIGQLEIIRDYLLPKLISGEIRIPDAEKLVGAA